MVLGYELRTYFHLANDPLYLSQSNFLHCNAKESHSIELKDALSKWKARINPLDHHLMVKFREIPPVITNTDWIVRLAKSMEKPQKVFNERNKSNGCYGSVRISAPEQFESWPTKLKNKFKQMKENIMGNYITQDEHIKKIEDAKDFYRECIRRNDLEAAQKVGLHRVEIAELKSAHGLEMQKAIQAMQTKLDAMTRERDLAFVRISEMQNEKKGDDALTKSIYDLRDATAKEKVQFLTKSFEEAQRAVQAANYEIVNLRRKVEDKEKPYIDDYESRIEDLEEQILRWKDLALKYSTIHEKGRSR